MKPSELRALAEKATPGPWDAARSPEGGLAQCVASFTEVFLAGPVQRPEIYMVNSTPEIDRTVAITGNGPTSPDNARYIAAASPDRILKLLAVLDAAKRFVNRACGDQSIEDCPPNEGRALIAAVEQAEEL